MAVASLRFVIDYPPLPDLYFDIFGQIFPSLSHHNKVLAFLTWLRSLTVVIVIHYVTKYNQLFQDTVTKMKNN